jgi:hypothetical protein
MPLKNKQYMMFSLAGAGTLIYKRTMIGTEIKTVYINAEPWQGGSS